MPPKTPNILFNPTPQEADAIVQAFFDIHTTLADIALRNKTSLEALTCWMARPDIQARLDNLESAGARRMRMVASCRLMHAVEALTITLMEFNDAHCWEHGMRNQGKVKPGEHQRRDRETARKSAQLLYRISHFDPTKRPQRASRVSERSTPGTDSQHQPDIPLDLHTLREALAHFQTINNEHTNGNTHSNGHTTNSNGHAPTISPLRSETSDPLPASLSDLRASARDQHSTLATEIALDIASVSKPAVPPAPRAPEPIHVATRTDDTMPPSERSSRHTLSPAREGREEVREDSEAHEVGDTNAPHSTNPPRAPLADTPPVPPNPKSKTSPAPDDWGGPYRHNLEPHEPDPNQPPLIPLTISAHAPP